MGGCEGDVYTEYIAVKAVSRVHGTTERHTGHQGEDKN